MKRTDFIQTREDIIANIKTLYSYLNGDFGDDYKAWAVDKMKRGHNFVVEIITQKINTSKNLVMEDKPTTILKLIINYMWTTDLTNYFKRKQVNLVFLVATKNTGSLMV